MATKGHSFDNHHPAGDAFAKGKGELRRQQKDPGGAPRFPPSEGQPPQAKRLVALKTRKQAGEREEARDEGAPVALMGWRDRSAAWAEAAEKAWKQVSERSGPVLREAQKHVGGLRSAAREIWHEAASLARTPVELARVVWTARRAA